MLQYISQLRPTAVDDTPYKSPYCISSHRRVPSTAASLTATCRIGLCWKSGVRQCEVIDYRKHAELRSRSTPLYSHRVDCTRFGMPGMMLTCACFEFQPHDSWLRALHFSGPVNRDRVPGILTAWLMTALQRSSIVCCSHNCTSVWNMSYPWNVVDSAPIAQWTVTACLAFQWHDSWPHSSSL